MDILSSLTSDKYHEAILKILMDVITTADRRLLEVGSGTGQAAVTLAPHFPWLEWYPTDSQVKLAALKLRIAESKISNIQRPQRVEIGRDELPKLKFELIYTADTFQLFDWKECKSLMKMFGGRLREGARVIIYGPFKYNGNFLTEAQAELDRTLKEKNSKSGIRSFEDVQNAMVKNGFELTLDLDMPEKNRLLIFTRLKHHS